MKPKKTPISSETQAEAMKIAKSTQKPGQTKEQTKLVAQGIEKGIAQYKKQQKERSRQASRAKKKAQKEKTVGPEETAPETLAVTPEPTQATPTSRLPWILLILSWIGFISFTFLK